MNNNDVKRFQYDPKYVVNGAVGSERDFCQGYMNPGASGNGYITTIKLSVGLVDIQQHDIGDIPLDIGTSGIVSYDRCECNDAYIGAINMLTASSFSGQMGAVWGYDLATAEGLRDNKLYDQKWPDGSTTPVYSIYPLLDATMRLFGTQEQRRFNPLPGAFVVCANKNTTPQVKPGETVWAWSFLALSFVENPNYGSNLFIEDCNSFPFDWDFDKTKTELDNTMRKVTQCTVLCGVDQGIKYKETFIGYKLVPVTDRFVGCALACAPYVTLARNAIPAGMNPSDLTDMTIGQWEQALDLKPLPAIPEYQLGFLGKDGTKAEYGTL